MHHHRANELSVADCDFRPLQKFRPWLPLARPQCRQLDYWQLASLTIAPWSTMKKGSSGCVRDMVSSRPSQNQKKKTRADKTEKIKTVFNFLKDDR